MSTYSGNIGREEEDGGGWGGRLVDKATIRRLLADYIRSEGCSCCRNTDDHEKAKAELAKLLRVPKYADGSGYDFGKFETGALKGSR